MSMYGYGGPPPWGWGPPPQSNGPTLTDVEQSMKFLESLKDALKKAEKEGKKEEPHKKRSFSTTDVTLMLIASIPITGTVTFMMWMALFNAASRASGLK